MAFNLQLITISPDVVWIARRRNVSEAAW